MLPPLDEIEDDLQARRSRAGHEGWLGEIEGIDLTLTFLRQKRDQTRRVARIAPTDLGMPGVLSARSPGITPPSPGYSGSRSRRLGLTKCREISSYGRSLSGLADATMGRRSPRSKRPWPPNRNWRPCVISLPVAPSLSHP